MGAEPAMRDFPKRAAILPMPEPRLLDEETSAAYLGISKSGFRVRWKDKQELPQPHHIGGRLLWDRKLLDRFVDELSGIEAQSDGWEL